MILEAGKLTLVDSKSDDLELYISRGTKEETEEGETKVLTKGRYNFSNKEQDK